MAQKKENINAQIENRKYRDNLYVFFYNYVFFSSIIYILKIIFIINI